MLLLLLACAPESRLAAHATAANDPEDAGSSPYLVDDSGSDAVPALTADQIASGIESAIDVAFTIDPALLFDATASIWSGRDDGDCPYYYPEYLELYNEYIWTDSCTAASGNAFSGSAYYYAWDGRYSYYYGTYDRYDYFYGDASLSRADGQTLDASGTAYYYDFDGLDYSGYREPYSLLQGAFDWTGPEYAGTWLAASYTLDLYTVGLEYSTGGRSIVLDGSLGGLSGEVNAVTFGSLYSENLTLGTTCVTEPGGTISVRDNEGGWYDVHFDGPAFHGASVFPAACDGCGDAWWRGQYVGQVCPDFAALLGWEGRPWG